MRHPQSIPIAGDSLSASEWLLRIVDVGLATCILGVPWLMGGRHPLGQLILVVVATVTAAAWMLHQSSTSKPGWRHCPAQLLLALAVLLLLVQIAPLPRGWIDACSPRISELLPLYSPGGQDSPALGAWSSISLAPWETRRSIALLLAYGMLFLTTVQRVRRCEDVERLLKLIALAAVLMAGFGLVQMLLGNGKFFWFYEHPFTTTEGAVKGAFSNRNHLAQFLAIGIGPLLWSLYASPLGKSRYATEPAIDDSRMLPWGLPEVAVGLMIFAGLLSLSRGGILSLFLATAVAILGLFYTGVLRDKSVFALLGAGGLLALMLAVNGYERISARLDQLGSIQTMDQHGTRQAIWTAAVKAAADFPLMGVGAGGHRFVYPLYFNFRHDKDFDHAESGYLQIAEELGLPGVTLTLAAIVLAGSWTVIALRSGSRKGMQHSSHNGRQQVASCAAAVLAALAANCFHSLVDFVWYVPACTALIVILAACACRLWQWTVDPQHVRFRSTPLPRMVCAGAAVAVLSAGGWAAWLCLGPTMAASHWDRFHLLAKQQPADAEWMGAALPGQAVSQALAVQLQQTAELQQVVACDPYDARARLRLAGAYLLLFHLQQQSSPNPMPLSQLRDAALASGFSSPETLQEWLARAVGSNYRTLGCALYHARIALGLCPLQGTGYLYLAELAFLENVQAVGKERFLDQALRVRPFDPMVLFQAGTEAWLAGDVEAAFRYWRQSFHSGPTYKKRIVFWFAGRALPQQIDLEIQSLVANLQPDLEGFRLLHARYRQLAAAEQLVPLRNQYLAALEDEAERSQGPEACKCWLEADALWLLLGDPDRAFQCAQKALDKNPNAFAAHLTMARHLIARGEYTPAEQHVRWCLLRRPDDRDLTRMLEKAVKGQINMTTQEPVGLDAPAAEPEMVNVSARRPTDAQASAPKPIWK